MEKKQWAISFGFFPVVLSSHFSLFWHKLYPELPMPQKSFRREMPSILVRAGTANLTPAGKSFDPMPGLRNTNNKSYQFYDGI